MPRYELVSNDWMKFWEFELARTTVTIRHGRRGTKGESTTRRFATPDEARHAYDQLIARKLAEGRHFPRRPGQRERGRRTKARASAIRQLEDVARKTQQIQIKVVLGVRRGFVRANVDIRKPAWGKHPPVVRVEIVDERPGAARVHGSKVMGVANPLEDLRRRYPQAALVLGKVSVTSRGCPLAPSALRPLVTRVLADYFASEGPAADEAAAALAARESATRAKNSAEVVAAPGPDRAARGADVWPDTNIKTERVVGEMKFTPDGQHLLIGLEADLGKRIPSAIQIWAPHRARPAREIKLPQAPSSVVSLAISPDGKHLVSGSRTLRIYALPTGRLAGFLKGHDAYMAHVNDVRFSPDGRYVASASNDRTARLWQFKSRKAIGCVTHKEWVGSVAFAPTGQRVITGCVAYSGRSTSFGGLQGFDRDGANEVPYELPYAAIPNWKDLTISHDGGVLVAANGLGRHSDAAYVWNLKTGRFLRALPSKRLSVAVDTAFTPDGKWLVTSHSKGIGVWSTKTWKLASTIDGAGRMALTADGRFIAFEDANGVRVRKFEPPRAAD